jgi:hypothetical protein
MWGSTYAEIFQNVNTCEIIVIVVVIVIIISNCTPP